MTTIVSSMTTAPNTLSDDLRRKYGREQSRRYRANNPDGYKANLIRYYCRFLEREGFTVTAPSITGDEMEVKA